MSLDVMCVTGGRYYEDVWCVARMFLLFNPKQVIVGDARGLDEIVRIHAKTNKLDVRVFYADWNRYGRSAGPKRNRKMLDEKPDYLLSFKGGKGTADCTLEAIRRGIPVFFPDNIHLKGE